MKWSSSNVEISNGASSQYVSCDRATKAKIYSSGAWCDVGYQLSAVYLCNQYSQVNLAKLV